MRNCEWQNIETAPKDGTDVLVMYVHIETQIVHNAFFNADDPDEEPAWWSYDKSEVSRIRLDDWMTPTHWMPLPSAPDAAPAASSPSSVALINANGVTMFTTTWERIKDGIPPDYTEEEFRAYSSIQLAREMAHKAQLDAERYRWLRRDNRPCDKVEFVDINNGCGAFGAATEDELDAAIDAALAASSPEAADERANAAPPVEPPLPSSTPGVVRVRCKRPNESQEEYRMAMGWDEHPSAAQARKMVRRWLGMIEGAYQCRDDIRDSAGMSPRAYELQFVEDEILAALASAPAGAGEGASPWKAVSDCLPVDGVQVVVYRPKEDWMHDENECYGFDMRGDGVWLYHSNNYEEYMAVGGPNAAGPGEVCTGPSERAPYTHWRYLGSPGAALAGEPAAAVDYKDAYLNMRAWAEQNGLDTKAYCGPRPPPDGGEPAVAAAQGGQQPVARVRVHRTGGNAGIAWSAVPVDGAPHMRDGELLYAAPAPAAPLTDAEIDACTDRQWGKGCVLSQYMAHRAAAREIQRACAAKWGITLAGTAQKGGEDA